MHKKIIALCLTLCFILAPATTFAASMTKYMVGNDNMHISLPNGWYINTPEEIDPEFLEVTENTESRLKKYLTKNYIEYNVVSKDTTEEINILLQHTAQTKAMFDFNLLSKDLLKEKAQTLIDLGAQEEDGVTTTYTSCALEQIDKCLFTVFQGTSESEEEGKKNFIQYTTTINGYGVTISYRANEGVNLEQGTELVTKVANSFQVTEVIETELKTEVYKQMLTPIALAGGVILVTAILIIRQVRKNRKEKK